MSKRKFTDDEVNELKKRFKESQAQLAEALDYQDAESGNDSSSDDSSDAGVRVDDSGKGDEDKEQPEGDSLLDPQIEEVLGLDPSRTNSLNITLHPSVRSRWLWWLEHGLQKEERDSLLEMYGSPEGVIIPDLNPETAHIMSKQAKARDAYMHKRQEEIGAALAAVGLSISNIMDTEDSELKLDLVKSLNEAAKLMVDVLHSQTKSRRAFILTSVDKDIKTILEETKPGILLFGEDLSEKLKKAKSMEKIASGLKAKSQSTHKQALNSLCPRGNRPFYQRTGQNSQRSRPRLQYKSNSRFQRGRGFQRGQATSRGPLQESNN